MSHIGEVTPPLTREGSIQILNIFTDCLDKSHVRYTHEGALIADHFSFWYVSSRACSKTNTHADARAACAREKHVLYTFYVDLSVVSVSVTFSHIEKRKRKHIQHTHTQNRVLRAYEQTRDVPSVSTVQYSICPCHCCCLL